MSAQVAHEWRASGAFSLAAKGGLRHCAPLPVLRTGWKWRSEWRNTPQPGAEWRRSGAEVAQTGVV